MYSEFKSGPVGLNVLIMSTLHLVSPEGDLHEFVKAK